MCNSLLPLSRYSIALNLKFTAYTFSTIFISKKHFHPGGMAPSEWMRSVRAVRDTPVADYSAPGVNTTCRVAYRPPIAVSLFLPQTLQDHSQMLLKAPAVMEVHSGRYEI